LQGLNKGDEVDLDIQDYKIILTPPQKILAHKTITIDVKNVVERVLRWKISSLHKKGYDEIIITNYSEEQNKIIEELITDLFVGFIIKEKSTLRIVVGQIAAVDVKEFDSTLRRAFRQLNEMTDQLQIAFEKKDSKLLMTQVDNEHNNNKLTNFCERLLNKHLKQKEDGHFWYVIAWNLEKIADNFKYIANSYEKKPEISKETLELYIRSKKYLEGYTNILYDFDIKKLVELSKLKKELEKDCITLLENGDKQDRIFLHYLHMIILQLADFSASTIAIKM
jgi:phosphate uptake regulator